MRILFHKLSDERHVLEIVRPDGRRERVECETRSYLQHDLLHYAAESQAGVEGGFWGSLAAGKTLAQLNDRAGATEAMASGEMGVIEKVVGVLSGVMKGVSPEELVRGLRRYADSLGDPLPGWLTPEFVAGVQERMRRLLGHWKATPFQGTMELTWPAPRVD